MRRRDLNSTWRAVIPSFSMVLTCETILSSTQSTVTGILAPHLSHSADIPHLTAITPVRFELGAITPGLASIIEEDDKDPSLAWIKSWVLKARAK